MKIVTAAGLIAGSVAAATLGLSHPALAAPAGPSSAQDTVDALNAAGYRVVLNKVGAGSLNACAVTSIRKVRPSPRSMSPQQGRPAEATTAV